jgi:addiction module antitoxin, relB/dinJ family
MAQIYLRVENNIKKSAEVICKEMGLSMSSAANIFLTKLVSKRAIPFEVLAPCPFYKDQNIAYLEKKMKDFKEGKLNFKEQNY